LIRPPLTTPKNRPGEPGIDWPPATTRDSWPRDNLKIPVPPLDSPALKTTSPDLFTEAMDKEEKVRPGRPGAACPVRATTEISAKEIPEEKQITAAYNSNFLKRFMTLLHTQSVNWALNSSR
jgi:hypothetical protein